MLRRRDHSVHIPEIFPRLVVLPKEYLALDQAAVAIQLLNGVHILLGQGLTGYSHQIAQDVAWIRRKWNRNLSTLDSPLDANDGRVDSEPLRDLTNPRVFRWRRIVRCTVAFRAAR